MNVTMYGPTFFASPIFQLYEFDVLKVDTSLTVKLMRAANDSLGDVNQGWDFEVYISCPEDCIADSPSPTPGPTPTPTPSPIPGGPTPTPTPGPTPPPPTPTPSPSPHLVNDVSDLDGLQGQLTTCVNEGNCQSIAFTDPLPGEGLVILDDNIVWAETLTFVQLGCREDSVYVNMLGPVSLCNIQEIIPGSLDVMTELQWFQISDHELSEIQSGVFSSLSNLKTLRATYNNIQTISVGAFPLNITEVLLSNNMLSHVEPGVFSNKPYLRTVDLQGNYIVEILPDTFVNDPRLLFLRLLDNGIRVISPQAFDEMTMVQGFGRDSSSSIEEDDPLDNHHLDLTNNGLTSIQDEFQILSSVERLYLGYNYIATISPVAFLGLDELTVLRLVSTFPALFSLTPPGVGKPYGLMRFL